MGIRTEWTYRNVSANLGIGEDPDGEGYSIGAKIYNSDANSRIKFFGWINYMRYYYNSHDYGYNSAITAGYKNTFSNGIYMSQEVGVSPLNSA